LPLVRVCCNGSFANLGTFFVGEPKRLRRRLIPSLRVEPGFLSVRFGWKTFRCVRSLPHRKLCDVVGYVEQRPSAPLVFRGGGGIYST